MTSVREWLVGLGLGQFADAFEAEQIELRALPELTESDLKDLGLLSPSFDYQPCLKIAIKRMPMPPDQVPGT
jgi:SAM domain (Sterile alpha motif)